MTTKHTAEPWRVDVQPQQVCLVVGGKVIASRYHPSNEELANMHRIAACVNDCKNINPVAVPKLLEACKVTLRQAYSQDKSKCYLCLLLMGDDGGHEAGCVIPLIESIIAEAEGETDETRE